MNQLINSSYVSSVDRAFAGHQNKNILPRLGVAWTPGESTKTVVRGGFGLYNDAIPLNAITANLPTQPPNRLTLNLNKANPSLPNPAPTPYGTSQSPPYGFNYPAVTPHGFDDRGAAIGYPSDVNGTDYNLPPTKTALWNFGIEHEFGGHVAAGVTYSGSHAWDITSRANYNLLPGDLVDGMLDTRTKEWGHINFLRNNLESNYHAMIVTTRQRLTRFEWQASYTWSHAQDSQYLNNDINYLYYGSADFDIRHRFSFSGSYELPSPQKTFLKTVAGGWTVGAISIAQTGLPFTVYTSANYASGGDYAADGNNYSIPDLSASIVKREGWSRSQFESGIFTKSNFAAPAGVKQAGVQGNAGRNSFRNPGYFGLDASLTKKTTLPWFGDRTSTLLLRFEALNVLNRLNLGSVNSNLSGNNFGQVTSANSPRVFQLGARFQF